MPVREGVVFLSFASEDREIVRAVRDKLALMNVETFFDESSLAPGAPWRKEIEEGIRSAWLFVPFLSRRALAQRHTPRVFWREWNTAAEQVKDLPASSRFVVRTTRRSRSIDTTASSSATESGASRAAIAFTYSIAPPSGYVKVAL